jgi:cytochrome b6-f complex iron-sulfur subunit
MNRREFLENACVSGLAVIAGTSVLSSLAIPTLKARTIAAGGGLREIPLRLEDTPELKEIGGMYVLEIEDLDKNILVARVSESQFVAVNIKCTHKGCKVTYKTGSPTEEMKDDGGMHKSKDNGPMFYCPCHESKYSLEGVPFAGPAKKPLGNYEVTFKDDEVTVKIPLDEGGAAPIDSTKTVQDTTKK